MFSADTIRHLTYLIMEIFIIGGVAFVLWVFHPLFLLRRLGVILLGAILTTAYALPLDTLAVARGWGSFNPAYVTGIYFLGGSLLLEEIVFWLGTAFVTISAVLIFAELESRGAPWWCLAIGVFLPIGLLEELIPLKPVEGQGVLVSKKRQPH